jgi:hypothetical protein
MGKHMGFCPLEHVNKNGTYPNLGTIACFGAAGATAGSGITLIACESPVQSVLEMKCNRHLSRTSWLILLVRGKVPSSSPR